MEPPRRPALAHVALQCSSGSVALPVEGADMPLDLLDYMPPSRRAASDEASSALLAQTFAAPFAAERKPAPGAVTKAVSPPLLASVETCCTCSALKAQVVRAETLVQEAQRQYEEALAGQQDAYLRLHTAQFDAGELSQRNADIERRLGDIDEELSGRTSAHGVARSRWEEEVGAWEALCEELRSALSTSRSRMLERHSQREAAEREAKSLRSQLQDAADEASRLHGVQSQLMAQGLQDTTSADDAVVRRAECQRKAVEQCVAARAATEAVNAELTSALPEASHVQALLRSRRARAMELESWVDAARQELDVLQLECAEERQRTQDVVDRLQGLQRNSEAVGDSAATDDELDVSRGDRWKDRSSARDAGPERVADLAAKLEAQAARRRRLCAENQRLRDARKEEGRRCSETVERLRCKVHRYRAGCTELRELMGLAKSDGRGSVGAVVGGAGDVSRDFSFGG
eukprot:TRINITY_DN21447_c0_g1_i2.p1 TRINITY_DN21447_c0_g1~~TRINITY_DN21447_c0_g1_i2.p1  ORF type:complete len:462 (-),score=118.70 TRINITY_DN21447_c0_g1_i2:83-1468(-)